MEYILDNIKHLCAKKNITLAELERTADIGNGVVARWSKNPPSLRCLKKVADYFNVDIARLLKKPKEE